MKMQAMLRPEDVAEHGAPWAVSEALLFHEIDSSSRNIEQVDESELCRKFDSEVIDERKSTSDRIKEVWLLILLSDIMVALSHDLCGCLLRYERCS